MSLAEIRHGLNSNGDLVNKMSTKIERLRENLSGEIAHVRDSQSLKLDQLDKYYNEEICKIETIIRNDKSDVKGEI